MQLKPRQNISRNKLGLTWLVDMVTSRAGVTMHKVVVLLA
jgi:hypothetical protein